ncbi:MAG: beta-ketoacyl synthase chain length factor [Burkholderiales bacterium]
MNRKARMAYVNGIGLWSPRLPGWEASRPILLGNVPGPDSDAARPAPALLPPNERRRAPDTVALSMEVASQACNQAGINPATLPCVFTSTHGDLAVTDYMCSTLASNPTLVSPTRFHNSVHNAAAGYWTIATGCGVPYTALSAHEFSFAQGLLEALLQLDASSDVLLVAYDIEAKGLIAAVASSKGMLGAALVLSKQQSANTRAALRWEISEAGAASATAASPRNSALVAGNAMQACLPMMEALAGLIDTVTIPLGASLALHIHVRAAF